MTKGGKILALAQALLGLMLAALVFLQGAGAAMAAVPAHHRHARPATGLAAPRPLGKAASLRRAHARAHAPLRAAARAPLRLALAEAPRPAAGTSPAAAAPAAHAPARPAAKSAAPFGYDDELILEIDTAHHEMSDSLIAYAGRGAIYLPLGALARFLDLPIAISDEGHYAAGWFLSEQRRLSLNLREGKLLVNGKPLALAKGDAVAFDGEMYLRLEKFAQILPLKLKLDMRAQTVTVTTLEPFPFEQRLARDAARDRLAGTAGRKAHHFPREATPYKGLTMPLGDLELRAMADNALGARTEADLRLAGDVAWMTGRVYLSGSSINGLSAAHVQLGRRDPDAGLLGGLHATDFQLGDVSTSALPVGIRSVSGRGLSLTNAPLEHTSVFDTINLTGDLEQGWEVELYRNDSLIGSTRTPINGQYQFLSVAVDYGLNIFRLVFYGPQGQRREEIRRMSVGDGRLGKGQLVYSLDAAQKDTSLINVHVPQYIPSADAGSWSGSALLRYGLTDKLTLNAGAGLYQGLTGKQSWMAYAGLRSSIAGMAVKLDGAFEQGAQALTMGLGGKLGKVSWVLSHGEYAGGFLDEVRVYTDQALRRATQLDMNTLVHLGSGEHAITMPLSATVSRVQYENGAVDTTAELRQSFAARQMLFANTLDYTATHTPGANGTPDSTFARTYGNFDLSTLSGSRTNYHATLGYQILPHPVLTSAEIAIDHRFDDNTTLKAALTRTLSSGETALSLAASRRFKRFTLSADTAMSVPSHTYAANLRLSLSFGQNPITHKFFTAQSGLAEGGAVAVRAYRDTNGNHQYDAGEELVKDAEFNTGTHTATTDAQGSAFIGQMGDGNRASYQFNPDSLPDIALAPYASGVEIVPRAGRIHQSDFGIIALSTITGSATYLGHGENRGVSGLTLWLVDAEGHRVAHVRSEADGYFLFEQVRPGTYSVVLDAGQAQGLNIALVKPVAVTVGATSQDLSVKLQVTTASAVTQTAAQVVVSIPVVEQASAAQKIADAVATAPCPPPAAIAALVTHCHHHRPARHHAGPHHAGAHHTGAHHASAHHAGPHHGHAAHPAGHPAGHHHASPRQR